MLDLERVNNVSVLFKFYGKGSRKNVDGTIPIAFEELVFAYRWGLGVKFVCWKIDVVYIDTKKEGRMKVKYPRTRLNNEDAVAQIKEFLKETDTFRVECSVNDKNVDPNATINVIGEKILARSLSSYNSELRRTTRKLRNELLVKNRSTSVTDIRLLVKAVLKEKAQRLNMTRKDMEYIDTRLKEEEEEIKKKKEEEEKRATTVKEAAELKIKTEKEKLALDEAEKIFRRQQILGVSAKIGKTGLSLDEGDKEESGAEKFKRFFATIDEDVKRIKEEQMKRVEATNKVDKVEDKAIEEKKVGE